MIASLVDFTSSEYLPYRSFAVFATILAGVATG
jgi:hypothetical protein